MPRRARTIIGGLVYHVLNRANGRLPLFEKEADYAAFERVLEEAHARTPIRILAYCLMPNHFHLVLWPKRGSEQELPDFMRWLTVTHAQRHHAHYKSSGTGHVYQSRYKSFPVQSDGHLLTVCRYVERNPLRAMLITSAQKWRWGSLWRRTIGNEKQRELLADWPVERPSDWTMLVNRPQTTAEEDSIRTSIARGRPLGDETWQRQTATKLDLEFSMHPRGRPKKPLATKK